MFTCKHLNRRSFLSGTGAAIFLPFLDAMIPAFAASSLDFSPEVENKAVFRGIIGLL